MHFSFDGGAKLRMKKVAMQYILFQTEIKCKSIERTLKLKVTVR